MTSRRHHSLAWPPSQPLQHTSGPRSTCTLKLEALGMRCFARSQPTNFLYPAGHAVSPLALLLIIVLRVIVVVLVREARAARCAARRAALWVTRAGADGAVAVGPAAPADAHVPAPAGPGRQWADRLFAGGAKQGLAQTGLAGMCKVRWPSHERVLLTHG